jgi:hypothetical protein
LGTKITDSNSLRPAPVPLALGGSSGRLLALKYLTFGTKTSNLNSQITYWTECRCPLSAPPSSKF